MTTAAQLIQSDTVLHQKIVLRAVHGKQQGKLWICAPKHFITDRLAGVAVMSQHQRDNAVRPVTEETYRVISDGMTLNLADPIDAIDWEWLRLCPEIVMDRDLAQQSSLALFYVEDLEADTQVRVDRKLQRAQLIVQITEMSVQRRREVARLLGQITDAWQENDVIDFLVEKAENETQRLMDMLQDPYFKSKLFFLNLQDKQIVTFREGAWWYGNILIGANETQAAAWMQDTGNQDIIDQLYQMANPIAAPKAVFDPIARSQQNVQQRRSTPGSFAEGGAKVTEADFVHRLEQDEAEANKKTNPKGK